jgi:hypothetical protein
MCSKIGRSAALLRIKVCSKIITRHLKSQLPLMKRYLTILLTMQLCIASFLVACTTASPVVDSPAVTAASEDREWLKEIDAVGAVGKQQIAVWTHCQSKFALTLARNTTESPESIIISTFQACRKNEDLLRAMLKKAASPDRADHFIDRLRHASRERLVLEIVAGRNPRN